MKFHSILDVQTFLTEVRAFQKLSESLGPDYQPTEEELGSFLKTRSEYVGKMKDYRRSANQKSNWRDNRTKMMKGIKAFHKSVNGKRFHRKLGRFLASRITRKANESLNYQGFLEQLDFLVGLNSVKQHLYVEMDYFHQAQEQIELEEMVLEYALPFFRTIEEKIVENRELTEDELIFLMDLTDTQEFMEAVAETSGVSLTEVSTVYTAIEENLVKEGIAKDDKQFYPVLVKRLCAHNWRSVSEN